MRLFAGMSNPLDPPKVYVCNLCVMGVCCALLINVHCKSSRCVVTVDIGVYAKWQQTWLNLFNHFHFDWHTHSQQKAKLDPAVTFPTGAKVGRQSATVNEAIEQANFLIMTFFFLSGLEIDHPASLSTCSVTAGINVAQNAECQPEAHSFSSRLCVMSHITLSNTPLKRTE